MLPFCHFVASTFTVSDYNNTYFLNIDIYIYKYSYKSPLWLLNINNHSFIQLRVSAVFYLHPVYIALVRVF